MCAHSPAFERCECCLQCSPRRVIHPRVYEPVEDGIDKNHTVEAVSDEQNKKARSHPRDAPPRISVVISPAFKPEITVSLKSR